MILCNKCHNPLEIRDACYVCPSCNLVYPTENGITIFSDDVETDKSYFSKGSFEKLFKCETTSFWYKVRNQIICQTIKRYLPLPADIIEVGCGTGFVASAVRNLGYTVDCADLYFDGLSFCQTRNAGRSFFQLNLDDKVFIEEYDAVCAFDVIEHIENDGVALNNMYYLLKEGGYAFITVPACPSLWSTGDVIAEHKRRYTHNELREKVEQLGFQVRRMTYFMTLLFPVYFIIRKCSDNSSVTDYTSEAVRDKWFSQFNPNPILNALLYIIFRIEPLILRYINLPFGSSLLCVARKSIVSSPITENIR